MARKEWLLMSHVATAGPAKAMRKRRRQTAGASGQCCVTSPLYFALRDCGAAGHIGLEPTPTEYVVRMVAVFREVGRALRDAGTVWLNVGHSYAGYRRDARAVDRAVPSTSSRASSTCLGS